MQERLTWLMSLFNQVLALPVSWEPRTVNIIQLCQNTALKTRKPQRSLEQQTSSAHSFSKYLQLLPHFHSSESRRRYSYQGCLMSNTGGLSSIIESAFTRKRALALSSGFVCFLQDLRGSTQGTKSLSGGNKNFWYSHKQQYFLGSRWSDAEMKNQIQSLGCSSSSPPERQALSLLFLSRPVQAAVGCWQPTSVQSTMRKMINPVFPTASQAEHCKWQLPSHPCCTLTCLTLSTPPQNEINCSCFKSDA